MEYDERKTKPESTRNSLIQQVQEQSSMCDVVVKMGYWEKRFHRCVLVASPFFVHVLNDNFREKETGKIDISTGTPVSLETAIMFLYGKKPKFNQENVENILHMAEFLLIPNLKSACIAWLKSVIITEENCLGFLQLSSIYDFEIQKCTIYIEEHLPEMLLNPQMVNLTKDSIHLLFSDKRLSYVSMDDKLWFLLKWSEAKPDTRTVQMQELLANIDFSEIRQPYLQQLIRNPDLVDSIKLETPLLVQTISHRVLVMKGENSDGAFWCLDLERDQWFRVESESFKEKRSHCYEEISGSYENDSKSVIYFVEKGNQKSSILLLDLSIDTCSEINVIESDERFKLERIDNLKIDQDICVFSVNENIKTDMKLSKSSELSEMQRRLNLLPAIGCTYLEQKFAMRRMENVGSLLYTVYMKTSTLIIGHIDNDNANVEMLPLLSFKGDEILQLLIIQNAVAITFMSRKYVTIYDLVERNFEKIEQSTENDDKLARLEDGFVIYNNKRCIFFIRLYGPCLTNKYKVAEIRFEHNNFKNIRHFICGHMLYRYHRESSEENFIFEFIPLHSLLSKQMEEPFDWKQLHLPKEAKWWYSKPNEGTCFEISLPKSKLRCNIECPHCKKTTRAVTSRNTYDYDSDEYIYVDSSDDDYCYYGRSYYDSDHDH